MKPWSKLPSWWFRPGEEALIALEGGRQAGTSQAALRVYLGLGAADRPNAAGFEVRSSLSDLQDLTQLSRVMVQRGIHRAVDAGLITYAPGDRRTPSLFSFMRSENDEAGGWAKLPRKEVIERVPKLPHRGANPLVALKLYLILLAGRPNDNTVVALTHKKLREKTGVQANQIRAGISAGSSGFDPCRHRRPGRRPSGPAIPSRRQARCPAPLELICQARCRGIFTIGSIV